MAGGDDGHSVVVYRVVYRVGGVVVAVSSAVSGRGPPSELIMLKRKQYRTKRERHIDRVAGFIDFFGLVLVSLAFIYFAGELAYRVSRSNFDEITQTQIRSVLNIVEGGLPYILIFGGIPWFFHFRPEFATGFMSGMAFCVIVPMASIVLFIPACFIALPLSTPFFLFGEDVGATAFWILVPCIIFCLAYVIGKPRLLAWWYQLEEEALLQERAWIPVPDITWESDVPEGKEGNDVA
jgi:hypothetical protein